MKFIFIHQSDDTLESSSISSPGLGLGLRPGFPLILGTASSGFVAASLPSLLHLRTRLLEQLATSSAGEGSAPEQKQRASRLHGESEELNLYASQAFVMTARHFSYSSFLTRKNKDTRIKACCCLSIYLYLSTRIAFMQMQSDVMLRTHAVTYQGSNQAVRVRSNLNLTACESTASTEN